MPAVGRAHDEQPIAVPDRDRGTVRRAAGGSTTRPAAGGRRPDSRCGRRGRCDRQAPRARQWLPILWPQTRAGPTRPRRREVSVALTRVGVSLAGPDRASLREAVRRAARPPALHAPAQRQGRADPGLFPHRARPGPRLGAGRADRGSELRARQARPDPRAGRPAAPIRSCSAGPTISSAISPRPRP